MNIVERTKKKRRWVIFSSILKIFDDNYVVRHWTSMHNPSMTSRITLLDVSLDVPQINSNRFLCSKSRSVWQESWDICCRYAHFPMSSRLHVHRVPRFCRYVTCLLCLLWKLSTPVVSAISIDSQIDIAVRSLFRRSWLSKTISGVLCPMSINNPNTLLKSSSLTPSSAHNQATWILVLDFFMKLLVQWIVRV